MKLSTQIISIIVATTTLLSDHVHATCNNNEITTEVVNGKIKVNWSYCEDNHNSWIALFKCSDVDNRMRGTNMRTKRIDPNLIGVMPFSVKAQQVTLTCHDPSDGSSCTDDAMFQQHSQSSATFEPNAYAYDYQWNYQLTTFNSESPEGCYRAAFTFDNAALRGQPITMLSDMIMLNSDSIDRNDDTDTITVDVDYDENGGPLVEFEWNFPEINNYDYPAFGFYKCDELDAEWPQSVYSACGESWCASGEAPVTGTATFDRANLFHYQSIGQTSVYEFYSQPSTGCFRSAFLYLNLKTDMFEFVSLGDEFDIVEN